MSFVDHVNSSVDRRHPAILLVVLSVFVAIGGWIAVGGFAYRQFFATVAQLRWRSDTTCALWHGEIVFGEQQINLLSGPGGPCQIKSIDPETGIVRSTGTTMSGIVGFVVSGIVGFVVDGDRMWVVSPNEVVETDGATIKRYTPKLRCRKRVSTFLLNGGLTSIAPDENGNPRLYRLEAGEMCSPD